jgi:predicted dehydrogenase
MSRKSTRREFVKQSSALGAAWWVGMNSTQAQDSKNPLERLNFACIGVQGKGSSDSSDAGKNGNVVALCDIDDLRMAKKAREFPKAEKFNDYRKMLDDLGDKIDAVTISTPDHHHAPAAIRALKLKKNVFCQKPLTWSLYEARTLRETAKKMGVATQMGNQGTAGSGLRESVEIVRAGDIGQVKEVHIWTNRPVWPQALGRPTDKPAVPANIHWDLFLGPAPERAFHPAYQPFKWRGWLDFGTGALGDMACHTMNMPVMALDLFDPISVQAETSGIYENETYPKWSVITYEFAARGDFAPLKMTWYDGGKSPDLALLQGAKKTNSGALLVGEKGSLYSGGDYGGSYQLLPTNKFVGYKKPEQSLPRSPGHFKEFADACRGGAPAMSNFDYAGRLTETVVLGNLSLFVDKKVMWDAKNLKATNAPELAKVIKRDYREGWEV